MTVPVRERNDIDRGRKTVSCIVCLVSLSGKASGSGAEEEMRECRGLL